MVQGKQDDTGASLRDQATREPSPAVSALRASVPSAWQRFRWWLVRKLAGNDTMLLNCSMTLDGGECRVNRVFAANFSVRQKGGDLCHFYGLSYIHSAVLFPTPEPQDASEPSQ